MEGNGLDSSTSEYGIQASSCEQGNEPSPSIRGTEFIGYLGFSMSSLVPGGSCMCLYICPSLCGSIVLLLDLGRFFQFLNAVHTASVV
jgi:hypothetical protein